MSEWILILLLATGETRSLPASPAVCMEWATNVALGEAPTVHEDGLDTPVVFALCSNALVQPAKPDQRSAAREGRQ